MRPAVLLFTLLLAALSSISCSSTPKSQKSELPADEGANEPNGVAEVTPRFEPLSKYGNPPFYEVNGQRYYTLPSSQGYKERGIASWYGPKFHGRRTSSGEVYDMHAMTAAHRSLPLPSYVVVTNLSNKRQIIVRVNDRGPFHAGRIIDLSYAAAVKLGLARPGTGLVEVRAIQPKPAPGQKAESLKKNLYLQIGAFQNRSHAEQLQKQLQSVINEGVKVSPAPAQQAPFYRVRIGPVLSVEKLDNLAKRLAELGFSDHLIVH